MYRHRTYLHLLSPYSRPASSSSSSPSSLPVSLLWSPRRLIATLASSSSSSFLSISRSKSGTKSSGSTCFPCLGVWTGNCETERPAIDRPVRRNFTSLPEPSSISLSSSSSSDSLPVLSLSTRAEVCAAAGDRRSFTRARTRQLDRSKPPGDLYRRCSKASSPPAPSSSSSSDLNSTTPCTGHFSTNYSRLIDYLDSELYYNIELATGLGPRQHNCHRRQLLLRRSVLSSSGKSYIRREWGASAATTTTILLAAATTATAKKPQTLRRDFHSTASQDLPQYYSHYTSPEQHCPTLATASPGCVLLVSRRRPHYSTLHSFLRGNNLKPGKLASSRPPSRDHSGHGHGHSHSHGIGLGHHHHHGDNIYLTSKNKADAGVRITRIGLFVNLFMAISKGIGGWYFNSQALVADAFHALTDLVSDFLTLSTVALALKDPTERFPNGYGKIESLGSLGVSGLLLFGGLAMGYNALIHIYAELFVDNAAEFLAHAHSHSHGHSHSHSHTDLDLGPNINAAWLALGSIFVKEWLYRATMKIARERKSSVLASNAVHHRIDSLTSIVALLAIGGSHFLKNASYLDPIGGLIVSVMVINAGYGNTRVALLELADVGLDGEMKGNVEKAVMKRLSEEDSGDGMSVKSVGGIKSGQNYLVEVTLEVPGGLTVEKSRGLEESVREALSAEGGAVEMDVRGVRRVKVRFVERGREVLSEFVKEGEGAVIEKTLDEQHDHGHSHENGHGHSHSHENGNGSGNGNIMNGKGKKDL